MPSVEVEVDREIFYEFPEPMDRDEDPVTIRIEAGSTKLKSCQECMELDQQSNGISFVLTQDF